jgi:hypothetical protein
VTARVQNCTTVRKQSIQNVCDHAKVNQQSFEILIMSAKRPSLAGGAPAVVDGLLLGHRRTPTGQGTDGMVYTAGVATTATLMCNAAVGL